MWGLLIAVLYLFVYAIVMVAALLHNYERDRKRRDIAALEEIALHSDPEVQKLLEQLR